MPRKFDGYVETWHMEVGRQLMVTMYSCLPFRGHRGFAFVEFTTHKDAVRAMEELSNTHFYGRHLVVDWVRLHHVQGVDDRTLVTYHSAPQCFGAHAQAKSAGGVEDARAQSQKDAQSIKVRDCDHNRLAYVFLRLITMNFILPRYL